MAIRLGAPPPDQVSPITKVAAERGQVRRPVVGFAALGALILIANVTLVAAWVASPDFKRVPQGPDQPPGWMATGMDVIQILLVVLAVGALYGFLVRPWIRERRVIFDGLLCLAAFAASIWDPASVAVVPWFSYNSYLLNYGNPLSSLPGWLSLNEPGRAIAWSFPTLPAFYLIVFPVIGIFGCAALRTAKRLFPRLNRIGLVVAGFLALAVFDTVLEGVIFMPLGFWTYPGGPWPVLSGGHYFQFPFNQLLQATAVCTAVTFLRYNVNDRGLTIVERGADQIGGGPIKKAEARLLAVVAAFHIIVLSLYQHPQTFWALNSHGWPKDVTDRSLLRTNAGGCPIGPAQAPMFQLAGPVQATSIGRGGLRISPGALAHAGSMRSSTGGGVCNAARGRSASPDQSSERTCMGDRLLPRTRNSSQRSSRRREAPGGLSVVCQDDSPLVIAIAGSFSSRACRARSRSSKARLSSIPTSFRAPGQPRAPRMSCSWAIAS